LRGLRALFLLAVLGGFSGRAAGAIRGGRGDPGRSGAIRGDPGRSGAILYGADTGTLQHDQPEIIRRFPAEAARKGGG
jgi:hypothetical protein